MAPGPSSSGPRFVPRRLMAVLAIPSIAFAAAPPTQLAPEQRATIVSVQMVVTPLGSHPRVTVLAPGDLTRIRIRGDYLFRVDVKNVSDSPILQSKVILTISDKQLGFFRNVVASERLPDLAPQEVASIAFVGRWQLPYASHSSVRVALRPAFAKPKLYPVTFTL